jgi:hypothetical protein
MKKGELLWAGLILLAGLAISNSTGQKIDRAMENQVEIIINHKEPYKVAGEPSSFSLEEEFAIDTATIEITRTGLYDIFDFAIDTQGNIYCVPLAQNFEKFIIKFDKNGRFLDSFIKRGQGPGEITRSASLAINHKDEIEVFQVMPYKFARFKNDGTPLAEKSFPIPYMRACTLENGRYLVYGPMDASGQDEVQIPLSLLDTDLKTVKELDRSRSPIPSVAPKMKFSNFVFQWSISRGKIFVANEERGYEILVYDLNGRLLRKIRKDYKPVKINEDVKQQFKKNSRFADKVEFPEHWGPFQSIFADDQGRLFVTTYEKGTVPGEYIHDIFNGDGLFIGRKSFKHFSRNKFGYDVPLPVVIKKNRLYGLQEGEGGYKKLVVSRIIWE